MSNKDGGSSVTNLVFTNRSTQTRNILIAVAVVVGLVVVVTVITVPTVVVNSNKRDSSPLERAKSLMTEVPLVDGHNDLPYQLKIHFNNQLLTVDLRVSTKDKFGDYGHTDIPRLREGHVGAQFWAAYMSCDSQYKDAARHAIEQIDVIKRYTKQYPDTFTFVTTAQGIWDAFNDGKIGCMIGVEGGHAIDSNLGLLRILYELGTRYMTITHSCNTPWADNWIAARDESEVEFQGLSTWGELVIKEMNRIGMLVDLSHVSFETMKDALRVATAPVIYSHSSAFALCEHHRNVPDDILGLVKENRGVVMVNFYDNYVCCYPSNNTECDLKVVANHLDYIKEKCGSDCVGFGADYDGVTTLPKGVEDVSTYPDVVAELITRGWSDEDIKKALGLNLIRALEEAEKVRDDMANVPPFDEPIAVTARGEENATCRYFP